MGPSPHATTTPARSGPASSAQVHRGSPPPRRFKNAPSLSTASISHLSSAVYGPRTARGQALIGRCTSTVTEKICSTPSTMCPPDLRDFPHHEQIYQYFNDYVDKFDLRSHVSAMCSLLGSSNPGARSCPSQRRNPSWWLTIFAARTLCPQEPRCFPRSSDKMRNWPDAMSAPSATPYRLTSPSTCTDYKCSALPARAGRTGKAAMPARRRLANEGAKCLARPGGRTRRILAPISAGSFQVTDEVPAGITRALPPQ